MTRLRVLLVEPYYAGSHRAWADGYVAASAHDVRPVTLPASFWKWRMQGGFVTLAHQVRRIIEGAGRADVILASSMTNLPGLLGAARDVLHGTPAALYMHENQLTYPLSPLDREDLTYAMVNWTSMTVAEAVFFNSHYHHDVWFDALPAFLGRFPDHRHSDLIDPVRRRSSVLPVGVDLARLDAAPRSTRAVPLVLWNQRWEYDKGPSEFAAAITALAEQRVGFEVAMTGEVFVDEPPEFTRLRHDLGDRIVHMGFADPDSYVSLLRSADVVVSTAHQEFFGIAITEAVYAGAMPLLPNRLVYPERIPPGLHAACLYDSEGDLTRRLASALTRRSEAARIAAELRPTMAAFDWAVVAPEYDARLEAIVDGVS